MILYYALGGGLGHIARSFALLGHAPRTLLPRLRLLVSSASAEITRQHSPCPMDRVPRWAMTDRGEYFRFLAEYIERHSFSSMILDTFPFGLLGELQQMVPHLPRVLVGRYLQWDAYRKRCAPLQKNAIWPRTAVMIEQQEKEYLDEIGRHTRIVIAQWPVSLVRPTDRSALCGKPACCIVHSGTPEEMGTLRAIAQRVMAEKGIVGHPEIFRPSKGLFPMEHHLERFSDRVTGAGYGSCASAVAMNSLARYHLHPFRRKFDDQALRLKRLQEGRWVDGSGGDTSAVATILWREVE